jgi:hypothetical protein
LPPLFIASGLFIVGVVIDILRAALDAGLVPAAPMQANVRLFLDQPAAVVASAPHAA